jgi:hypothetical protein
MRAGQTGESDRPVDTINRWPLVATLLVIGGLSMWALLYWTYRVDRSDTGALIGASMNVLLLVPPLASYLGAMQLTRGRPLWQQTAFVYMVALVWLFVQRALLYPAFGLHPEIGENIANFLLLPAFGIASWLSLRSLLYRRRLEAALALQAQSELRLLEAQLAPHMLFNMLNTVYSVMLTDAIRAVPLFLSMSEMLRHVVDRTRHSWVALDDELDFIRNYAALETARNPEGTRIAIVADGDLAVPIPPMLLATLFENAVKHGRMDDGSLEIRVRVRSDDDGVSLDLVNRHPDPSQARVGMGLGLANLRRRLELLYPRAHAFEFADADGYWSSIVRINP